MAIKKIITALTIASLAIVTLAGCTEIAMDGKVLPDGKNVEINYNVTYEKASFSKTLETPYVASSAAGAASFSFPDGLTVDDLSNLNLLESTDVIPADICEKIKTRYGAPDETWSETETHCLATKLVTINYEGESIVASGEGSKFTAENTQISRFGNEVSIDLDLSQVISESGGVEVLDALTVGFSYPGKITHTNGVILENGTKASWDLINDFSSEGKLNVSGTIDSSWPTTAFLMVGVGIFIAFCIIIFFVRHRR